MSHLNKLPLIGYEKCPTYKLYMLHLIGYECPTYATFIGVNKNVPLIHATAHWV